MYFFPAAAEARLGSPKTPVSLNLRLHVRPSHPLQMKGAHSFLLNPSLASVSAAASTVWMC